MTTDVDFAWCGFWPVWIKYCGVCDEFEMLKSKWKYFSEATFSALPSINDTFDSLDLLIESTNDLFKPMFDRTKLDQKANFKADLAMERAAELQKRFVELTMHVGLLKFVFFQRMVSSEIPHVVSGLPLSPERTVGNEAIYIAADNVARRYYESLRLGGELSWDGVISFVYPITGGYIGGFNRPSKLTKKFQISLTEEGKNFLGSYLLLAHEFGHSTHYSLDSKTSIWPSWFEAMWGRVFKDIEFSQQALFQEEIRDLASQCRGCFACNYLLSYVFDAEENSRQYEQCIADLFAFLIGGPATCLALVDILNVVPGLLRDLPIRPAFLRGYLSRRNDASVTLIENEISNMRLSWASNIQQKANVLRAGCIRKGNLPTLCFDLLRDLGEHAGMLCAIDDTRLHKWNSYQDLDLPCEKSTVPNEANSITSSLVRDRFNILSEDEERIKKQLLNHEPCNNEDPKSILHCYYLLHRKDQPPDYATTLFSLAFNANKKRKI